MIRLLVERGAGDIAIGEGMATRDPKDVATTAHAFATLGYTTLKQRYGVKVLNVFERPFEPVDLGDDIRLKFNPDINEMIAVNGCPPNPSDVVKALHRAGISADAGLFDKWTSCPASIWPATSTARSPRKRFFELRSTTL